MRSCETQAIALHKPVKTVCRQRATPYGVPRAHSVGVLRAPGERGGALLLRVRRHIATGDLHHSFLHARRTAFLAASDVLICSGETTQGRVGATGALRLPEAPALGEQSGA